MSELVSKAIKFFRSYGVKCEDNDKYVEEWLNCNPAGIDFSEPFCEYDLYNFNDWLRWKDTAYEEGIDDQTKIERLLEEISDLKSEVEALNKDNNELRTRLGINYF